MPSSYSGDPAHSPRDAVRFLVGDAGPTFEMTDPEIDFLLGQYGLQPYMAAAAVAESLAGRYARDADITQGDIQIRKSARSTALLALAGQLREAAATGMAPTGLGIADDSGCHEWPEFWLRQMDNRRDQTSVVRGWIG